MYSWISGFNTCTIEIFGKIEKNADNYVLIIVYGMKGLLESYLYGSIEQWLILISLNMNP